MSEIRIEKGGKLTLPPAVARMLEAQPLRLSSCSTNHLLLETTTGADKVLMTGLLNAGGIVDLLSFFNMFRKSGMLHFLLAGGNKTLCFQNGEIVYAVSTFPEEEIGEILYSLGKFDRETLQGARQFANGELPLGKILVDQHVIDAKDLWAATKNQVETIVYNLFAFQEGSFVFR